MSLPDDSARREIADSTGENVFVNAGAGSGKTTALVRRVVRSVIHDDVPLAATAVVTFTEKAGAELRDRLRAAFEKEHRSADSPRRAARAERALDELDGAAIGTLHSFAQRVLASFPVQAGLPPLIEVLDEVGSSVAFDERWSLMWRRMLDDEALADALHAALDVGVKSDQLRSLARAFGSDWDLIQSHVLAQPVPVTTDVDADALVRQARLIVEQSVHCRKPESDRFFAHLVALEAWTQAMRQAETPRARFQHLMAVEKLATAHGLSANWPDLAGLRGDFLRFKEDAAAAVRLLVDATLRPLARWIAEAVQEDALRRISTGELEFHDLLVAARELVRRDPEVRGALQRTYRRLLLDEFQDTDPIQIELAVRIAGGADASADDWHDVAVPPGALFVVGDPKQSIYRFRRASIETYLDAERHFDRTLTLSTNFRSTPPVLEWVNAVFGEVIQESGNSQPAYAALHAARGDGGDGPAVAVLGAEPHAVRLSADALREVEAADVAAVIVRALTEGWQIVDAQDDGLRPVRASDIAVLIPARTSLPALEEALDRANIPYRAESSSLAYRAPEVRALLAAARAIADPTDELACVTALRSPLFGCGDDELFAYRRDGGTFVTSAPVAPGLADTVVGRAMAYLRGLHRSSTWLTPAELLAKLIEDRRSLEVAVLTEPSSRARERWGTLRFVVDQARAWSDVQHGGLREYLAWAARQGSDSVRVAEAILPEQDLDVVRIMTIHAAKGLEFGMVVLSGMTSQPRSPRGVRLLWKPDGYAVSLSNVVQTNDFASVAPVDEQMDQYERRRLLYVAATRARDHLVVSLHRTDGGVQSAARILAEAGAGNGAVSLPSAAEWSLPAAPPDATRGAQDETSWRETISAVRAASRRPSSRSASGLEGTEPDVVFTIAVDAEVADAGADDAEVVAGRAKGARDVELPPWLKGRYGDRIGRAVHAVLQSIPLDGSGEAAAMIAAQCAAEGVMDHADEVAAYVRSALSSPIVRTASSHEHWCETFVATTEDDDTVLEGFMDLVYREPDGSLVVVDYKTDSVPHAALPARAAYYAPQIHAYQRALGAATGAAVRGILLFVRTDGSPAVRVDVTGG